MIEKPLHQSGCCEKPSHESMGIHIAAAPPAESVAPDEVCCGSPTGPASRPHEKPGYALLDFVATFVQTPAGPVPLIRSDLRWRDHVGRLRARLGINRAQYKVAPGLYGVGTPDDQAPVLVTANYKLSFDSLRKELKSVNAWILVLDTRGINVWCAAGKNLF